MLFDRRLLIVFTALGLSVPYSHLDAATKPRIIPLQTNVTFSAAQSTQNHWSAPIKSTDGRAAYVLLLEPEADGNHVDGVNLVLRRPHDKTDAQNLLAPMENWHGVQSFMFLAWDFKQGVKKSIYGEKRTISVENLGLVVQITVSKAVVNPSGSNYQLDALDLKIEVDNAPDVQQPRVAPPPATVH